MTSRQGLESWVVRHLKGPVSPKPKADAQSSQETVARPSTEDANMRSSEEHVQKEHNAGTVSMSQVLCEHGRLAPYKAGDMKLITRVSVIGYVDPRRFLQCIGRSKTYYHGRYVRIYARTFPIRYMR